MNFQVANNYGEKIYKARKSKKMSRVELGELVDLHQTSVKKYEDGNIKNPSIEKLTSFAKILDIPLLDLLHFEPTDVDQEIYTAIPFYVDQIYSAFNQAIDGLKKADLHEDDIQEFLNKYVFEDTDSPLISYLTKKSMKVYDSISYSNHTIQYSTVIDHINNPYPTSNSELIGLKIMDDSMNNLIKPGMYALIEQATRFNDQDIILCCVGAEPAILRKWHLLETDMVVLKCDSDNSTYKSQLLEGNQVQQLKIIGKYIGQVSPIYL